MAYELLSPPVDLVRRWLTWMSQAEAENYIQWLDEVGRARADAAWALFGRLGFGRPSEDPLVGLAKFVFEWWPGVLAPYALTGLERVHPTLPVDPTPPTGPGAELEASLAHEIGFILVSEIRAKVPGLAWGTTGETARGGERYGVALPAWLGMDPIGEARVPFRVSMHYAANPDLVEYLNEHSFDWRKTYRSCVDYTVQMVTAPPEPLAFEVPLPSWGSSFEPRRPPQPEAGPAPARLVEAVESFRRAGFFADASSSSADELAMSLQSTWRASQHADLPLASPEIDGALLLMDYERVVFLDTEADVVGGNRMYEGLVHALAGISGGQLKVRSVTEDWSRSPTVVIEVKLPRRSATLEVRAMGDRFDHAIVEGVNTLMPKGGARFWYYDDGTETAVIVRATEAERQVLRRERGVELQQAPPGWWASQDY